MNTTYYDQNGNIIISVPEDLEEDFDELLGFEEDDDED